MIADYLPNDPSLLLIVGVYTFVGIGLLGGYGHWGLLLRFLYAGTFPVHWVIYETYNLRYRWYPFVEPHLWWMSTLIKLFIVYAIYKWWIGDWPGDLFGEP